MRSDRGRIRVTQWHRSGRARVLRIGVKNAGLVGNAMKIGTPARGTQAALSLCHRRITIMLHYAVVFFVIALIAALFGFTGIAAGAAGIAKILFVVFLVVAVVSLLLGRRSAI